MKSTRCLQVMVLTFILSLPVSALGDDSDPGSSNRIENPLKNNSLIAFINSIIDAALLIGTVIAVLAIIFAGFRFVTAQGDEEQIKTAKRILLYAAIGIVILLGARMISDVIVNTITSVDEAARD